VTSVQFAGPASYNTTGNLLAGLTPLNHYAASNPGVNVTNDFFLQDLGQTYFQVNSGAYPFGDIRGQIASLVSRGRRHIPYSFTNIFGNTLAPNGLASLGHENQVGFKNNQNSYISLQGVQLTPGSGNYTYEGVFNFYSGARKKNLELVRGILLEVNIRSSGLVPATWVFELFNAANQTWVAETTFTANSFGWVSGFIENYDAPLASGMATNRGVQLVRITSTSATPSLLFVDLLALRFYTPNVAMNNIIKTVIKVLPQLPTN